MKWMLLIMTLGLLAGTGVADAADKALCVVCALNGETELETVVATRELDGKTYSFCSEKCAAEFDADPAAYVFASMPVPDLRLVALDGKALTTADLRGKVILIDFWATWCKPCVKSMPDLNALHRESGGNVVVVGVSVDTGDDREKKVKKFLSKHPVEYPIVVDTIEKPVWETMKVKVLPTLFVIGPDGTVVSRYTGAFDMGALKREIAALQSATR